MGGDGKFEREYEGKKLLVSIGTDGETVTPAGKTVITEEISNPPLFVPIVEQGELQDSLADNGTQNNTDMQYTKTESS